MLYLILFIIVISVLILFFLYLQKNKKQLQPNQIKKEKLPLDELLVLNVNIRKKISNQELIAKIEIIVDKLRNILPALNEKYQVSELTWVANRMATDYLQKVLNPYMEFQEQEQKDKKDDLIESLEQIEKELDEIIELVKKNETSQFDVKAKFIKNRFK